MPKIHNRCDVLEFGRELIETGDLDPVYIVVHQASKSMPIGKLQAWLVAYWCFYHCGTASWIVDQPNYWDAFAGAAATKEHPRSSERRHFRGANAIKAVRHLRGLRDSPANIVWGLGHCNEKPLLAEVVRRAKKLHGFGDWIAFKIADMLERLGLCPVEFSTQDIFGMYESPTLGAILISDLLGSTQTLSVLEKCSSALNHLNDGLGYLAAPPRFERMINVQEIETICCKFVAHFKGRYKVGKDIAEVKHGLMLYARKSRTAQQLLRAGRESGLW